MHHYYDMNDYLRGAPVQRFTKEVDPAIEQVDPARLRNPVESDGIAEEKNARPEDSSFYVFNTHVEAQEAIRSLDSSGFDVKKLSLVGKGYYGEEQAPGLYTAGDRINSMGSMGAFWGGVWGLLLAPAVFFLPGLGLMAMGRNVVSALVGTLDGAMAAGSTSPLGPALAVIGVPLDHVAKYEADLKANKYVLMVHGSAEEMRGAHTVLTGLTHAADASHAG